MIATLKFSISLTTLLFSVQSFAGGFDACSSMFYKGRPPVINAPVRALCFDNFAVLHSGVSKTPLFSAERLNKTILADAKGEQRTNQFYADARLPSSERAELSDYAHSGYDRGHMSPAGDMPNQNAMAQSFSLANMVPQAPINNRKTWADIEKDVRKYVRRAEGDVFVVTGPIFTKEHRMAGHVWIPDYLFKLVIDDKTGKSWVHVVKNDDSSTQGMPISYEKLVEKTGIQYAPAIQIH